MIVVDASVLANVLADDGPDGDTARRALGDAGEVTAPDLVDVETVAVLRKRWLHGTLTEQRFTTAVTDLQRMPFERVPTRRLVARVVELRDNVSAYDACYVALAEQLGWNSSPLMEDSHRRPARGARSASLAGSRRKDAHRPSRVDISRQAPQQRFRT